MKPFKQKLIDRVIERIKEDISSGDITAIEELLTFCPTEDLINFLPEEEWGNFKDDNWEFHSNSLLP
jgi:hypothetical protein